MELSEQLKAWSDERTVIKSHYEAFAEEAKAKLLDLNKRYDRIADQAFIAMAKALVGKPVVLCHSDREGVLTEVWRDCAVVKLDDGSERVTDVRHVMAKDALPAADGADPFDYLATDEQLPF